MASSEAELQAQIDALESFISKLNEQKSKGIVTEAELISEVLLVLVDELIEETVFEVHRAVNLQLLCVCPVPAPSGHV